MSLLVLFRCSPRKEIGLHVVSTCSWRPSSVGLATRCGPEDVRLLNEALQAKLLPNGLETSPALENLVATYRAVEKELEPDRTIGSIADWNEGRDERIGIRGSYTELAMPCREATSAFWRGAAGRPEHRPGVGELQFCPRHCRQRKSIYRACCQPRLATPVWGGLVRTPDDFGHLGQTPSHPELLDYLATRFMADGWSLKKLVKLLVGSAAWRQSGAAAVAATEIDPENRLWHHMPLRRLEAEAIRDSMLAVSGRLDSALYGRPIDPFRTQRIRPSGCFAARSMAMGGGAFT